MKNRYGWVIAPAVLGAFLFFSQPSIAQQSTGGQGQQGQQGQQGEFQGEHTDTGEAALGNESEKAEAPEGVEANETAGDQGHDADNNIDLQESVQE